VSPNPLLRPPAAIAVLLVLAAAYDWAVFATTFAHPGVIGPNYNTPGTDWMVFWSAATSFWQGHLDLLADGTRFTAWLNQHFASVLTQPLSYRPWIAPPSLLVLLIPFGLLGFNAAYAVFQVLSAGLLAAAFCVGARDDRASVPLAAIALLSPAAALNVVDGQTGFLIAALLVAGLRLLDKKPVLAGLVLGVLSIKPQYFLMVPLALLAGRQWKALAATILSAAALATVSVMVLGFEAWIVWIQRVMAGDPKWIEHGRLWGNSIYASAVILGASPGVASALQAVGLAGGAAAVWVGFRRVANADLKCALLLTVAFFAAPHNGPYEAMLPAIGACLWLKNAQAPVELWRWLVALAVWCVPLVSPPAVSPPGVFAPLLLVALIVLILKEGLPDQRLPFAVRTAGA
jgi:hypothetical protein